MGRLDFIYPKNTYVNRHASYNNFIKMMKSLEDQNIKYDVLKSIKIVEHEIILKIKVYYSIHNIIEVEYVALDILKEIQELYNQ